MGFNLLNVFENNELKKLGKSTANIISLAFKTDSKSGARIVRAVLDNGTTLVKKVTAQGAIIEKIITLPEITSTTQRNNVILDLAKNKMTQEQIAAMLDISQSTVSNIIRKSKK